MTKPDHYRRAAGACAVVLLAAVAAGRAGAVEDARAASLVEQGRRIYMEGTLVSGAALTGRRANGIGVSGEAAACVQCHRRSGMGTVEGDIQMLPVNRPYLFPQPGDQPVAVMDLRFRHAMNVHHAPYTDETLARAVREGINSDGARMNELMPQFELGDADRAALAAYLRQLSSHWSPGVTDTRVHLATVIAPGVDPARSKAVVDALRAAVAQKNGSTMPGGGRHMVSAAEMMLRTERFWDLQVWTLEGPPETWRKQLEERYRAQPVFAIVSGISEGTWQPVQDFCNAGAVACWFPSVDLPPAREEFYSLYFSRGVLLEADVLGKYLGGLDQGRPKRLVQVFRDDETGRAAAAQLQSALGSSGIAVENRVLKAGGADELRAAFGGLGADDAVVGWLRRADIAALEKIALPQPGGGIYFSGRLAGGEHAPFTPAWRQRLRLVYPYMLPEQRVIALSAFFGWQRKSSLQLVEEPLQEEVFYSAVALSETLSEMLNNLYTNYMMERAEEELGRREAAKAEQLSRDFAYSKTNEGARERERIVREREAMKADSSLVIRRESTMLYPRVSLSQQQRFASKGAYIVHYTGQGDALALDSGWIVP